MTFGNKGCIFSERTKATPRRSSLHSQIDVRSDLPVRFPMTTPTESLLTVAGSVSKRLGNSSGTGDQTETKKGFGTTNALVVLKDALVSGADSRLTSYKEEIVEEVHKLVEIPQVEEISTKPSGRTTYTVATWADDHDDAMRYLRRLNEAAKNYEEPKAIISAAREYAATGYCEDGFQSYICSLESDKLVAYRVYAQIQHNPGCKLCLALNCPCGPTRLHGFEQLQPGIYSLGSGSRHAIEYLAGTFGIDLKRISLDEIVGYKIQIQNLELTTRVEEVKMRVWLALRASALSDKYTGTPFRVCSITRDGNHSMEECSFLRLQYQFYSDQDDGRSVFLVYPNTLIRKDHGHHLVRKLLRNLKAKKSAPSYGHPLTWLRGDYCLHKVKFYRKESLEELLQLQMLKEVSEVPEFSTDIITGMRYFLYEGHKVFVVGCSKQFVGNLFEEEVLGVNGFRGDLHIPLTF